MHRTSLQAVLERERQVAGQALDGEDQFEQKSNGNYELKAISCVYIPYTDTPSTNAISLGRGVA